MLGQRRTNRGQNNDQGCTRLCTAVQVGSAANGVSGHSEDGVHERRPLRQVVSATTGR